LHSREMPDFSDFGVGDQHFGSRDNLSQRIKTRESIQGLEFIEV